MPCCRPLKALVTFYIFAVAAVFILAVEVEYRLSLPDPPLRDPPCAEVFAEYHRQLNFFKTPDPGRKKPARIYIKTNFWRLYCACAPRPMHVKAAAPVLVSWAAGGPDKNRVEEMQKPHAKQFYTQKYFN